MTQSIRIYRMLMMFSVLMDQKCIRHGLGPDTKQRIIGEDSWRNKVSLHKTNGTL